MAVVKNTMLLVWGLLLGSAGALVAPLPQSPAQEVGGLERRQTCNTASNRQCWTTSPAFNINTDYEVSTPVTGVTRTVSARRPDRRETVPNSSQYTFTLTEHNSWTGGDGRVKTKAMLVNGTSPCFQNKEGK